MRRTRSWLWQARTDWFLLLCNATFSFFSVERKYVFFFIDWPSCCSRRKIARLKGHKKPVSSLLVFGEHLLALDELNVLRVWDFKANELYCEIELLEDFTATCMMHPATYLNKILLGSRQGALQLWNIRTRFVRTNFSINFAILTSLCSIARRFTISPSLNPRYFALVNHP